MEIRSAALVWVATIAALLTTSVAADSIIPVKDANAAIEKARRICRLEPRSAMGEWHGVLVNGTWHVWFGETRVEPLCGFIGAFVQADGSFTSCAVSACSATPIQRH